MRRWTQDQVVYDVVFAGRLRLTRGCWMLRYSNVPGDGSITYQSSGTR